MYRMPKRSYNARVILSIIAPFINVRQPYYVKYKLYNQQYDLVHAQIMVKI